MAQEGQRLSLNGRAAVFVCRVFLGVGSSFKRYACGPNVFTLEARQEWAMGRISELKQWLTLPEAAAKLAECLNEEVSANDVLQLVLGKHLKLTVSFLKEMQKQWPNTRPKFMKLCFMCWHSWY